MFSDLEALRWESDTPERLSQMIGNLGIETVERANAFAYRPGAVKKLKEALNYCRISLKLDPENIESQSYIAQINKALGRPLRAYFAEKRTRKIIEGAEIGNVREALKYSGAAKQIGANNLAERVLSNLDPDKLSNKDVYMLSVGWSLLGRTDRSIEIFEPRVKENPRNRLMLSGLAKFDINAGRFDDAITYSTRAIELDPENPRSYEIRAEAHRESGDFEKAEIDEFTAIRLKRWTLEKAICGETENVLVSEIVISDLSFPLVYTE